MRIEFEMTKDNIVFKDAIELPDDHNLSAVEINLIKQQRFDRWLAATIPESLEE
jgi:hypothetical protein